MSVQVRRRREAAAFLVSYVGAQGELLVDTTNNRVQVHDGVTPGGFAAASTRDMPGFNLGINTNGAINQRGVTGTVTLSAGQYGHDRMKAGAAGCTYTFAAAANGDTIFTITTGSLVQAVDVQNIYSTALWLTWTGTVQARVYQGAASAAPAYGAGVVVPIDGTSVAAILATGLALGTITMVEFGTGTLNVTRPWQLEAALPNAGPTRLARRHAGHELALCQRYFAKSFPQGMTPADNVVRHRHAAFAWSATDCHAQRIYFPTVMRSTSPVLTFYAPSGGSSQVAGMWQIYDGTSAFQNATSMSVPDAVSDASFCPDLSGLSLTSRSAYICYGSWTASAEL